MSFAKKKIVINSKIRLSRIYIYIQLLVNNDRFVNTAVVTIICYVRKSYHSDFSLCRKHT